MSFKIRRVVSGLSPSEHISEARISRSSDPSFAMETDSPNRSRLKRLSVDIEDFIADGEPETNNRDNSKVKTRSENSEPPNSNQTFPTRLAHSRTPKHSSDPVSVDQSGSPTKSKANSNLNSLSGHSFRSEKIIDDTNEFRPSSSSRINLGLRTRPETIEFDSSDHSSPEKPSSRAKSPFVIGSPPPRLSDQIRVSERSAHETTLHEQAKTYTPRRSSPLRKEVSHNSSATGDLVEELRQSSVLRSRSAQEILDQINSSMDKIRADDNPDSSDFSDTSSSSEDQENIGLQDLGDFVPGNVLEDVSSSQSRPVLPKKRLQNERETPFATAESAPRTQLNGGARKENEMGSNKRLKPLRTASYGAWSFEKWDKLKRLIESPVPNAVIIQNAIVMKELGCANQQELQQRVDFLLRNNTR